MPFSTYTPIDFLFYGWRIDTYLGLILALLMVTFAAMTFEGYQFVRYMQQLFSEKQKRRCTSSTRIWLINAETRIFQTGFHIVQMLTGYMLMLCSMSYNTWINVCIILGSTLGYMFVRPAMEYYLAKKLEKLQQADFKLALINGVKPQNPKPTPV